MEQTRHRPIRGTTTPHSGLRTPNSKGFTLIEIVITIVLVSILAGIAAMIILQGVRAYSDEQIRSDVHYQARLAMERMAREMRQVRSCGAPDLPGMVNPSASIIFTDINDATIPFSRTGTDLMRGADVLARNITALQFRFLDINGNESVNCGTTPTDMWLIEISLTTTDTQTAQSLNMLTRVYPRNF
jgi:prepilin-type N-terminal cleavage/methylation domain-containing protein